LYSSNELGELSQWLCHDRKHRPIIIVFIIILIFYYNYFVIIIFIYYYYLKSTRKGMCYF